MDRQFLEFWGNFLINVAKGQKQLEDMAKWLNQGLNGYEDLTFVATDRQGNPQPIPAVIPETELEKDLYDGAPARAKMRRERRAHSKTLAEQFGVSKPWERKSSFQQS